MTDHGQPHAFVPPHQPAYPQPYQPEPPRRRVWPWLVGGAVVVVLMMAAGVAVAVTLVGQDRVGTNGNAAAAETDVRIGGPCIGAADATSIGGNPVHCADGKWVAADPSPQADGEATAEPGPAFTPTVANFSVTAKVKEKQCYGSAGCHVEFDIELSYVGPDLDPSTTYELTYEVHGVEDGPLIGTTEITGDKYSVEEHFVSTPKSSTKLTVEPLEVSRAGY